MDLEIALERIYLERQNLNEDKVLSGIKTIDNLLKGFDVSKKYLIVGQQSMAIETFVNTIKSNINILYKSQIDARFLDFKYIEKQKLTAVNLNDLKQEIIKKYDVIIALFRPSYFDLTLDNNNLEFQLLKNTEAFLQKGILELDIQDKRVKSIRDNTVLQNISNKLKTYLTEEN